MARMGAQEHVWRIVRLVDLLRRSIEWDWDPWVEMEWLGSRKFRSYFGTEPGRLPVEFVPRDPPGRFSGGCGTALGWDLAEWEEMDDTFSIAMALAPLAAVEYADRIEWVASRRSDEWRRVQAAHALLDMGEVDRARAIAIRVPLEQEHGEARVELEFRLGISTPVESLESASVSRWGAEWDLLALSEAAARAAGDTRQEWEDELSEFLADPRAEIRLAARIGLARIGELETAEVLALIGEVNLVRRKFVRERWALALSDALLARFDAEIYDRYRADRVVKESIDDGRGVRAFFAQAGIELEESPDVEVQNRIVPGIHTSLRRVLARCRKTLYAHRDGVRILGAMEAIEAWKDRLEGR